jgi:hypothetical protein
MTLSYNDVAILCLSIWIDLYLSVGMLFTATNWLFKAQPSPPLSSSSSASAFMVSCIFFETHAMEEEFPLRDDNFLMNRHGMPLSSQEFSRWISL